MYSGFEELAPHQDHTHYVVKTFAVHLGPVGDEQQKYAGKTYQESLYIQMVGIEERYDAYRPEVIGHGQSHQEYFEAKRYPARQQ